MRKKVLITGASSGLGMDFARLFAADGFDLVLLARREEKLRSLAEELTKKRGINASVLVADLSKPNAAEEIFEKLKDQSIEILVNNAGFGHHGLFSETDKDAELRMMQVNMVALTHLTKLLLPAMIQNGHGRILNVASTGAFQPGPYMAVYYATKAYVLFFSEALSVELKGTGVTVTCLCPGPTVTEFQQAAKMENVRAFRLIAMDSKTVVRIGYRALMKGKRLVTTGIINNILAFATRLAPRGLVLAITRFIMTKARH